MVQDGARWCNMCEITKVHDIIKLEKEEKDASNEKQNDSIVKFYIMISETMTNSI